MIISLFFQLLKRFHEAEVFDEENIKWLDMNVPLMFRYTWYGTFNKMANTTQVDMEAVNRAWLDSNGYHDNFVPLVYKT